MFSLHVLQARYGDCLLLECGTSEAPRYVLVDGGPDSVYERDLHPILQGIGGGGDRLDLIVLSHVDGDHVTGLLDLVNELVWQRIRGLDETIAIDALWHNSFSETLGGDLSDRLVRVLDRSGPARSALVRTAKASRDIAQGDELTRRAIGLGVPINPGCGSADTLTVGGRAEVTLLGNLTLRVIGPTEANLAELRVEWLEWLRAQEDRVLGAEPADAQDAARSLDDSVPNLSSIVVLAEADGKSLLLTGDARSDHIEQGLEQAGLLGHDGTLHVDVLKLPHHGSKYNTTQGFFRRITADTYIVSASGRYGHPHRDTLRWIVGTARDQGRRIDLVATNSTSSLRALVAERDPTEYGYRLTVMPTGHGEQVLDLSTPSH